MAPQATKIVSLFLFSSLLAASACDEASLQSPGDSLREVTKYKTKMLVGGSLSGSGEWPDGTDPAPWPFPDMMAQDLMRWSNPAIAAGWAVSEDAQALCSETCADADLHWNETAFAEGDYDFGEVSFHEGEEGSLRYSVEVEYLVELGCNCVEG